MNFTQRCFFKDFHRPRIVCLCGSTRFRAEFEAETKRLTLEGRIVITVGYFSYAETGGAKETTMGPDAAEALDRLHLRKIDLADWVHVISPGGYVGTSTAREVAYARSHGKAVTWFAPPDAIGAARIAQAGTEAYLKLRG